MKFLSQVLFSAGLISFALTGCERHDFEATKGLHLEHGHHGEAHAEGHGEGHAADTHAKVDDHGKADAAHAKEAPAAAHAPEAPAAKEEPRATGL